MKARHPRPESIAHSRRAARRALLRITLSCLGTTLLVACGTPPPPPQPATSPRAQALLRAGFVQTDEGWEFSLTGKLLFDHDSSTLDAENQAVADRLGRELAILGIRTVRIEGHTDNVGSDDYNKALSLRRAQAVQNALAAAGLHDAVIEVRGMGRSGQLTPNLTPEQRLQNRRVAVIVPAQ